MHLVADHPEDDVPQEPVLTMKNKGMGTWVHHFP
jgi:hypothetical protein